MRERRRGPSNGRKREGRGGGLHESLSCALKQTAERGRKTEKTSHSAAFPRPHKPLILETQNPGNFQGNFSTRKLNFSHRVSFNKQKALRLSDDMKSDGHVYFNNNKQLFC